MVCNVLCCLLIFRWIVVVFLCRIGNVLWFYDIKDAETIIKNIFVFRYLATMQERRGLSGYDVLWVYICSDEWFGVSVDFFL